METKITIIDKINKDKYKELSIPAKYLYLCIENKQRKEKIKKIKLLNKDIQKILNVSNKTAVKILKELEEYKLIKKIKENKNTNYIILKTIKNIILIKKEKILYKKVIKTKTKPFNYDWLKESYERLGV